MMNGISMPSYYEIGSSSNSYGYPSSINILQRASSLSKAMVVDAKPSSVLLAAEAKALAACKSHKEAERRRRKRINGHLATLRTLLPNLIKTDKASLLGEVVRRVRELKKTTTELRSSVDSDACSSGGSSTKVGVLLLPGDADEVRLCRCEADSSIVIATLCCEDRPELMSDLTRALRSVKAKVVRAEMATVGGRTKSILWVQGVGGGGGHEGPFVSLSRALKVVVDKPSSSGMGHRLLLASKRQRLYH
ncbi:hypothetical protein Nepgr_025989 [Nepenthes gracilis]|uniref:BHLH domain-containing protein n=1 Tax=Nepenthes gracilis TaxID=150966 RepID=A0AAD3T7R1_NEPGR|nr:hypothetical protein Nepgr_025989 [Nepenthes gracilis]